MRKITTLLVGVIAWNLGISQTSQKPESPLQAYQTHTIDTRTIYQQIQSAEQQSTHNLWLIDHDLYLHTVDIYAEAYDCVDHHKTSLHHDRPVALKGHTAQGLSVTVTISPTYLMASIDLGSNSLWIEPARLHLTSADSDTYVSYYASDVDHSAAGKCGVTETHRHHEEKINTHGTRKSMNGTCYEVDYAICHDYSMTQLLGSTADVEAFGVAITNEMNDLYDNQFADVLYFKISGQVVSTCSTCDPWTPSTNISTVLNDFSAWAPSNLAFTHDDATLWSNRDFDGFTVGLAWVGAICSNSRYNVCEHLGNSDANRRLVTHEVGHNFSLNHVPSGQFVMRDNLSDASDVWAASSITDIEAYYPGLPCLDSPCQLGPPTISWTSATSIIAESTTNNNAGGTCSLPYQDVAITLVRGGSPGASISVSIGASNAGTASAEDYDIQTPTVTFGPTDTDQDAIIRIYDDAILEQTESIVLDLTVAGGTASPGAIATHTIDIEDTSDEVSVDCCSAGGTFTYLSYQTNLPYFFAGNNSQSKSRFIIPASQLIALGMTAGPIESIAFNVAAKNSTGPFQDYTIGMAHVSGSALPSSWIATTTVLVDDVTTTLGWNEFILDQAWVWDGVSSLYIDLCFNNNGATVGTDILQSGVLAFNDGSFATVYSGSVCNGTILGTLNFNAAPRTRLSQSGGARIESLTTTSYGSPIPAGTTAHYYSDNNNVIVSITNTDVIDLTCVDVQVHSAGTGKSVIPNSSDHLSDKSIYISTDNNATYSISLHYLDTELSTWASPNTLQIAKSNVPFASTTNNDLGVLPAAVTPFAGSDSGQTYSGNSSGDGYYGLTDRVDTAPPATVDGHLSIEGPGSGILMTSPSGNKYRLYAPSSTTLTTIPVGSSGTTSINGSSIYLTGNRSVYLQPQAGGSAVRLAIDITGQLIPVSASTPPAPKVGLLSGDFELGGAGNGIIIQSVSGTCHKVSISDGGSILVGPAIPCP